LQQSALDHWQSWRAEHGAAGESAGADTIAASVSAVLRASSLETQPTADAELRALCVDLNSYTVFALEGPDARSFLQGYVTCDVNHLGADNVLPGAFTSLQGRVVSDALLLELDGMPAFVLHRSVASELVTGLQKYLQFAKASLLDLSERYLQLGIVAPSGDDTLPVLAAPLTVTDWGGGRAVAEPGIVPRLRLLLPLDRARSVWMRYRKSGATAGEDCWALVDVASGIAHIQAETANAFLPQMLNLDQRDAISFSKGCYLGQEIVARAQHRGQVKRRLQRLSWHGPAAPATGTALLDRAGRSKATLVAVACTVRTGNHLEGLALAVGTDDADGLHAGDVVFGRC
jgi:tRNA-modifying protein YgfZ